MPKIRTLPPGVASLIAAGEVVERPASALKELVENALDAGAGRIAVEVLGAGKTMIRVADDGSGMDPEDCAAALARHATSKLSSLEDLSHLSTFGFRGEALFAIAAVSRLVLTSAQAGAKNGWRVEAEGGKILASRPAPAAPGTTVEVEDIFFNTPARRKFLKSDAFEKSALIAVVEEAAMANPRVRFGYKSEGRSVLSLAPETGPDGLFRRARATLGRDAGRLLQVVAERPGFKLQMLVSPPEGLVASRQLQYWFVNRRPIAARTLQQALYRAYKDYRGAERHPVCAAFLELPPDAFDVNVHPGKREIRFKSDREVHEVVAGLIASALAKSRAASPLTAESRSAGPLPEAVSDHVPAYYLGGRSFLPEPAVSGGAPGEREPMLGLGGGAPGESSAADVLPPPLGAPRWFTPPYRYLGQIEKSYLVYEADGGIFVLDQHAAAERILFETYLAEIETGQSPAQRLMLPVPIELPASRVAHVLGLDESLARLGFELAPFGKTTLHVLAAPAAFQKSGDLKEIVHRLLDALESPAAAAQDVRRHAVATIACKTAVKAHDPLSVQEALRLIEDLKNCRDGSCCPHGRRAILALNREELARRFQRPGAPPL